MSAPLVAGAPALAMIAVAAAGMIGVLFVGRMQLSSPPARFVFACVIGLFVGVVAAHLSVL